MYVTTTLPKRSGSDAGNLTGILLLTWLGHS